MVWLPIHLTAQFVTAFSKTSLEEQLHWNDPQQLRFAGLESQINTASSTVNNFVPFLGNQRPFSALTQINVCCSCFLEMKWSEMERCKKKYLRCERNKQGGRVLAEGEKAGAGRTVGSLLKKNDWELVKRGDCVNRKHTSSPFSPLWTPKCWKSHPLCPKMLLIWHTFH